jgi:hypothetical protein
MKAPLSYRARWNSELAWIATSCPVGQGPEAVHAAMVDRGLSRFGDVVEAVAEALFARDRADTGTTAGIGLFRNWYLLLACRQIERLLGTAIAVVVRGEPAAAGRRVG